MKAILSNKKYLTVIIFSVVAVLTVALILPHVFALSDSKGELVKPKEQPIAVESAIQTTDDTEVEKPIAEEAFVKITAESVVMGDVKFNYDGSNQNRTLHNRPVKTYKTDKFDEIELDAENNTIYWLNLSDETAIANTLKAKSKNDADLKEIANKISAELGADLSKYDSVKVEFDEFSNKYHVNYKRTVAGYETSERLMVSFDSELNFCSYSCTPNVFYGIDVSNLVIDEEAIAKQIDDGSIAKYGASFGYNEIQSMILTIEDSKILMSVSYIEYNKNGEPFVKNGIARKDIVIQRID